MTSEWTPLYGKPRPTLVATLAQIATGDGLFVIIGLFFLGASSSVLLGWVTPTQGIERLPQPAMVAVLSGSVLGLSWALWRIGGSLRDALGPQQVVEGVASNVEVVPTVPESYRFTVNGTVFGSPLDDVEAPARPAVLEGLTSGRSIRVVTVGRAVKQLWVARLER
jgi:hypothetical protein